MTLERKFVLKICLLGEANVGKTSLVYRYISNKFRENYKSTLGVNLLKKDLVIDSAECTAQIWDLGGQESFKSLRPMYLEGANGALILYDMTNKASFEKVSEWLEDFREARGDDQEVVLIANKADLIDQIVIKEKEARKFASKNDINLIITSAKTGENVEAAFIELIKRILKKLLTK